MLPSRICSSAPAASSVSATSCYGSWPIPNCISPRFCGRHSGARSLMRRLLRIRSVSAVLAGPATSWRVSRWKGRLMLKLRVMTAVVLLLLFLLALFALPVSGWIMLVVVVVAQGAAEWSRLSKLTGGRAYVFWALTLVMMLGLVWFDASRPAEQQVFIHLLVYAVSALLWLIVVPTWLMTGWKVANPYLMALVGWALLVPTGLAMMDLRAFDPSPWVLLFVMGLVAAADISAYFAGRKFGKNKLAPSISHGKTWEGVAGAMLGESVCAV